MARTRPPARPDALSILLVDDHSLMLEALEIYLTPLAETVRVWKATSMLQALSIRDTVPNFDLVLLDLRMPDMDGLEGMRHLRAQNPSLPVVIISGDDSPETVSAVIAAGASGFIPKSLRGSAIQEAVKRVLAGERYLPERIETPAPDRQAALHLTAREQDVLRQLVDGHSNKEIARAIQVEASTVALHLTHLYRKLHVTSRAQAIRRAFDLGLTTTPHA